MKVYTRGGDGGETSLLSGGRVGKASPRVEAYGTIDELSSLIGLLRCEDLPDETSGRLDEIQQTLFAIGASLADPEGRMEHPPEAWEAGPLEDWIDAMDSELDPLRVFILPGGSRPAALAHVARTICRRAERRVLSLTDDGPVVQPGLIAYLNRLSDALFVLARFLNSRAGVAEIEWRPTVRD
jgi:cob(I)alamin adenosyltransferase